MKRILFYVSTCVMVLAIASMGFAEGSASKGTGKVIGYITKSASNQGWILINQGAADAAAEAGYALITLGPAQQGSLTGQLNAMEDMITRGVKAVAIAPVDSSVVASAVTKALKNGIPAVTVYTAVEGAKVTSFVVTDNLAAAIRYNK